MVTVSSLHSQVTGPGAGVNGASRVSLAPAATYEPGCVETAVRACLEPLGGMSAFVHPGQRVLLKPNLLGGFAPELAVTTHPAVVRAVVDMVREAGGEPVIGDSPGVGDCRSAAAGTGILAVAESAHVDLAEFSTSQVFEAPDNRVARRIELARAVADADVIISLPKLKTHVQMMHTGALKNQFGLVVGSAKAKYHFRFQDREWLADLIIDINRIAKPSLAILDAVVAMEGDGPSGGSPRQLGLVAASRDLASLDAVCCEIIGLQPAEMPLLRAAARVGYGGSIVPPEIEVVGEPLERFKVSDFRHVRQVRNVLRLAPLPVPILKAIRRQMAPSPRIDASACIRCGLCRRGCPVEPPAIDPFAAGGPVTHDATCIRCYCCHEFCPVKAIRLQRSWLDRLMHLGGLVEGVHHVLSRLVGRVWRRRGQRQAP